MLTRAATARAFSTESLKVVNNVAKQRFEVSLRDVAAVLGYEQSGKHITFHNTEVPEQFQGKGVGQLLAKSAFDHASEMKLDVTCKCHFLAKYYEKNLNRYKGLKVKLDLEEEE